MSSDLEGRRLAATGLSRRQLLKLAAAGVPVLAGLGRLAVPQRAAAAGPIVKPLPPEWFVPLGMNAEMRWDAVPGLGYEIPNERFFVRNHTTTPIIDARWRGVPLRELLLRAGISRRAVDVMPEGLDAEVPDQGHVRRPLPVEKALDDVLVAYEMNGEPLPPDHGAPARLVVPGWIGIASIKWLGRIEVADHPLFSPWNTTQYRLTGPTYPPDEPPLTQQAVKSAFELPFEATLAAGRRHVLTGRSWSGAAPIRRVDVSADGGRSFAPAELHGPNLPNAWVRWRARFTPRTAGTTELIARATDARGRTQPATVPFNDGGYLFWAAVRHPVQVTA